MKTLILISLTKTYEYTPEELKAHPASKAYAEAWSHAISLRRKAVIAAQYDTGMRALEFGQFDKKVTEVVIQDTTACEDPVIGYFVKSGELLCSDCVGIHKDPDNLWDGVSPVKVYRSNVTPYTQHCHKCEDLCYAGPANVELFKKAQ